MKTKKQRYSYGQRPLWHWVLFYLVIGFIIYGVIYYFDLAKNGEYSYLPSQPTIDSY
jgi:hypothetical protein